MARRPSTTNQAIQVARKAICEADDADGLRVAQAVLLPLLGLSLEQTAEIVGRSRYWVSRVRNQSLQGKSRTPSKRGGRRRALVPEDEEVQLVRLAIQQPNEVFPHRRVTVRQALRALLDERSDNAVAESTVTAMLKRVAPKVFEGLRLDDNFERVAFWLSRIWLYYPPNQGRTEMSHSN